MNFRGSQISKGAGQYTPQQHQQYLLQKQMQQMHQMAYQEGYDEDGQSYHYEPNQQIHPGDSYRSGNDFEGTPGSRYSVKNTRDLTPATVQINTNQHEEEDNYEFSRTPSIYSSKHGKDDNFKVIIRVRPPLPREQDSHVPFRSCLHISPENKSVSLMEYMGAEVDEAERQRDIEDNPQL